MGRTPKDEATDVMNMLLPFAEQMLREHGESCPYGGVMLANGSLAQFGAHDGNEHPKSKDLTSCSPSSAKARAGGSTRPPASCTTCSRSRRALQRRPMQ